MAADTAASSSSSSSSSSASADPAAAAASSLLSQSNFLSAWSESQLGKDPERALNSCFLGLLLPSLVLEVLGRVGKQESSNSDSSKAGSGKQLEKQIRDGQTLRRKYLAVFWLFKMADWLQGPYLYDVYASKMINGKAIGEGMISKLFLSGFCTTALLGPSVGQAVDKGGRRAGSLAYAFLYSLAALSTRASSLPMLFAGRFCGGVASSLLAAAPEAWLVSEYNRLGLPSSWLRDTFGVAFLGDFLTAILAGQFAAAVAKRWGPQAPFLASAGLLAGGAALAAVTWNENVASAGDDSASAAAETGAASSAKDDDKSGIWRNVQEGLKLIWSDKHITSLVVVQALFEGSMYNFVMQWPPAMVAAMKGQDVPFGKVFSCLMASCMLGSSLFKRAPSSIAPEHFATGLLSAASLAMAQATRSCSSLSKLLACFCLFEACVGAYFPTMGTLRSKYVPDSHRGIITSLSQVPMNLIVVGVMLGGKRLGLRGSLGCSAAALSMACLAQALLCIPVMDKSKSQVAQWQQS